MKRGIPFGELVFLFYFLLNILVCDLSIVCVWDKIRGRSTTVDHSDMRGLVPPDFSSSWSCLALESWIIPMYWVPT